MRYATILALGSFLMVSCGPSQRQLETAESRIDSLQNLVQARTAALENARAEVDSLKFGASRLLRLANKSYEGGNLGKATAHIQNLIDHHPVSEEAETGESLLQEVEAEKERRARERRREQERAERERKQRLERAVANMRTSEDEVDGETFYYDKSTPYYPNSDAFYLYIGKNAYRTWLRLKVRYSGGDWLFVDRFIIKTDDHTFTIDPSRNEMKRDNSGGAVWEWYDTGYGSKEKRIVEAVINSDRAILRAEGDQYYSDDVISSQQKRALQRVLDANTALEEAMEAGDS